MKPKPTSRKTCERSAPPLWDDETPDCLMRSEVGRKVPIRTRMQLNRMLLRGPAGSLTLGAVEKRLRLQERYGVSQAALRSYAGRLEALVRPVLTSHLLSAVLGCLPPEYRRSLADGDNVLLLSKAAQALAHNAQARLEIAELARLASAVTTLSRQIGARVPGSGKPKRAGSSVPPGAQPFAREIRGLYGLPVMQGEGADEHKEVPAAAPA